MNTEMTIGVVMIVFGLTALAISQIILIRWLKKYNREWMGDGDEMS